MANNPPSPIIPIAKPNESDVILLAVMRSAYCANEDPANESVEMRILKAFEMGRQFQKLTAKEGN